MSLFFDHMPGGNKKFKKLDEGDINGWILNQVAGTQSLRSLSHVDDVLVRCHWPVQDQLSEQRVYEEHKVRRPVRERETGKELEEKPLIFHNAWNLDEQKLALFSNRPMISKRQEAYKGANQRNEPCARARLFPSSKQTVKIDGDTYCEGALVDTVNFDSLIEEHGNTLDEIWVSRIVDSQQVRKPKNLHDCAGKSLRVVCSDRRRG